MKRDTDPSYAPLTMCLLSNLIHLTSSSWPSRTRKHAPHSMSQSLMVLSLLPLTTNRSLYCKHAIPRLCPFSVRTNSHVDVFHTLIVLSPLADTIYFSSKSTTLTAARWPTNTRLNAISVCDVMSQTAIERSCKKRKEKTITINQESYKNSQYSFLTFYQVFLFFSSFLFTHITLLF